MNEFDHHCAMITQIFKVLVAFLVEQHVTDDKETGTRCSACSRKIFPFDRSKMNHTKHGIELIRL